MSDFVQLPPITGQLSLFYPLFLRTPQIQHSDMFYQI